MQKQTSAKRTSIIAISAALYAVFFFLSFATPVPNFTVLYLPIILLGIFPLWFGLSGLIGSMIGAFLGGVYVEGLPLHLAWIEVTTALIIYGLNWFLIPKLASKIDSTKGLILLSCIYALTLFLGTIAILWQFTLVGLLPAEIAWSLLPGTFALNLPIALIACPALIRAVSPKLQVWGLYSGNFAYRRNPKNK
jgi:hypothetical protein